MKPDSVIYQGLTKTNQSVLIRYPRNSDLLSMFQYINQLSSEKTFILYQGEKVSLPQERLYLQNLLKKIKAKQAVCLHLFVNNHLAGSCDITTQPLAKNHIGNFGISLLPQYRHHGLGSLLLDWTIKTSKKHIPDLKIITLDVFSNNKPAIGLYRKFGFQQYGVLPRGAKHRHRYVDLIQMYKTV